VCSVLCVCAALRRGRAGWVGGWGGGGEGAKPPLQGTGAMGFSLGDLFLAGLLCMNAMAILHEKRFLNKSAPALP
jgi:hypothetical protein